MPRKTRFYIPKIPVHVVQRGNNRQEVFFQDEDYAIYLDWLETAAETSGCIVHAYALMPNHVHLLVTPKKTGSVSRMMQNIGRRYVPYINETYERSGTLWGGRYKASLVEERQYLIECMKYIETNPLRSGLVDAPKDYPWSSYAINAYVRKSSLVRPHKRYLALGADDKARRSAYRALLKQPLDDAMLTEIRDAWQTGTPLGSARFRERVERILDTKVGYSKRGRPRLNP